MSGSELDFKLQPWHSKVDMLRTNIIYSATHAFHSFSNLLANAEADISNADQQVGHLRQKVGHLQQTVNYLAVPWLSTDRDQLQVSVIDLLLQTSAQRVTQEPKVADMVASSGSGDGASLITNLLLWRPCLALLLHMRSLTR